jgi:hypothetical protein
MLKLESQISPDVAPAEPRATYPAGQVATGVEPPLRREQQRDTDADEQPHRQPCRERANRSGVIVARRVSNHFNPTLFSHFTGVCHLLCSLNW